MTAQAGTKPMIRIGHGVDAHAFGGDKPLTLGGVVVPHSRGLLAHSDGDVVIHALCDALLGALALGDIGHFFPSDETAWAGKDSRHFLRAIYSHVLAEGYQLQNADLTIVAQVPKLAPYIDEMRQHLAKDLSQAPSSVSIKATTTDRLGFTGREEGIAVHAVVLVGTTPIL